MLNVRGPYWALLLVACTDVPASAPTDVHDVEVVSQALSGCDEMVPANRYIDGMPAYAQCSASTNSAIFSNNGIDTSLTSMGSDWVKTQYSGGYQCTELAHRYLYFRWNVKWLPNGNAGFWCDTQPPANSGVVQTMVPVHGDVMVLAPGSCGASADTGHVNLIDTVDMAAGKVSAVEQNQAGRHTYNISCGKCFLHVMANDGVPKPLSGATTPPPAAGSGATAAAGRPAEMPGTTTGTAGRPGGFMPPARAGAAAPVTTPPSTPSMMQPAAAGTPAVTAPVSMMAPPVTPLVNPSAMSAGSAAPTSTRPRAPATSEGCAVAGVGEQRSSSAGLVLTLGLGLGLGLRRRRRGV